MTSICHTNTERYPFLVLEYDNPVKVSEVIVYNRDDCCGDRLKNLHVIVTDQYPEVGKMAEGMVDQFRGHPSFYYVRSKGSEGGG